jgi:hypothetical protein
MAISITNTNTTEDGDYDITELVDDNTKKTMKGTILEDMGCSGHTIPIFEYYDEEDPIAIRHHAEDLLRDFPNAADDENDPDGLMKKHSSKNWLERRKKRLMLSFMFVVVLLVAMMVGGILVGSHKQHQSQNDKTKEPTTSLMTSGQTSNNVDVIENDMMLSDTAEPKQP